eukprot:4225497-Prorocentrum_lima.AAC.1
MRGNVGVVHPSRPVIVGSSIGDAGGRVARIATCLLRVIVAASGSTGNACLIVGRAGAGDGDGDAGGAGAGVGVGGGVWC